MYESICDALRRELDMMDEKYSGGATLSDKDLEDIDKMAHALKSLATYKAMTEGYERRRYYPERDERRRY